MYLVYMSLFGMYYLIGKYEFFKGMKQVSNGYNILGSLGTNIILLITSFDWFWRSYSYRQITFHEMGTSPEFMVVGIIIVISCVLFYWTNKNIKLSEIDLLSLIPIVFIGVFFIGQKNPRLSLIIVNAMLFLVGLLNIRKGVKSNHLGVMNYGLIVITALIICRFFDTDISFIVKGILFITVGVGFFLANYQMLKKRKQKN